MSEELTIIPIELLVFSGRNPRQEMKDLEELAENIKEYGILQPIIVRPKERKFEIVVGERRVRASIMAGLEQVPATVRALTDSQTDELRLIENIHRTDLTDAEKGEAVLGLWANYDKYKTIRDVADAINTPYKTVLDNWCRKARKLSDRVKEYLIYNALDRLTTIYLLKYSHAVQDKLAEVIVKNGLGQHQSIQFLKLYDANPKVDLDELANKAKGIETITLFKSDLPSDFLDKIEEKRQLAKMQRIYRKPDRPITKITKEDVRKRQKKRKSEIPLLPEEKERIEEVRAKEIQRIIKERKKRAVFMKTRAELEEMEVKLPTELSEEYHKWIEETRRKEIMHRNKLNDMTSTGEWVKFTKSWFIPNPPPRKLGEILHPAKFPETIIAEFIEFFTKQGQVVLDPLLGTGSTLVACDMTGRIGIGVELEEQWAKIAKTRTKQTVIVGDSRNLDNMNLPQIDFVITSPPYWNQLKRASMRQKERAEIGIPTEYSEDGRNIGNIDDYMAFIEEQKKIFDKVYEIVKPGGYLVIITNNVFFGGRLYPLAFDTAISLSRSGKWILKDEKVWLQDDKKLLPLGVLNAWVGNRCHEYCLIFRKES